MPYRKYSPTERAEAVALAALVGAETASEQLGMDSRAIRRWSEAAGKKPADTITAPSWERVMETALARAVDPAEPIEAGAQTVWVADAGASFLRSYARHMTPEQARVILIEAGILEGLRESVLTRGAAA